MEIRVDEGIINKSKEIQSLEGSEYEKMGKYICRIDGASMGTGFFCKIQVLNELIPVLMTNHHVIDDEFIQNKKHLPIYINNENKVLKINNDRKIYSSIKDKYDIMIIRLKEEDKIKHFLEIDLDIFKPDSEYEYKNNSIYILHFPKGDKASYSSDIGIEKVNKYDIKHTCNTELGSSGGPILSKLSNKVIGIHKGFIDKINGKKFNIGTFLKFPLNELNNNSINIDIWKSSIKFDDKIIKSNFSNNLIVKWDEYTFEKSEELKNISFKLNIFIYGNYPENEIEKELNDIKIIDKSKNLPLIKKGKHKINPGWVFYFFDTNQNIKEKSREFEKQFNKEYNVILFFYDLNNDNFKDFIEIIQCLNESSIIFVIKKKELFQLPDLTKLKKYLLNQVRTVEKGDTKELFRNFQELTFYYNQIGDEIIFPFEDMIWKKNIDLIVKHLFTINILVIGRPKCGKSELINKLLGKDKCYAGARVYRFTERIPKYIIDKYPIQIYDTPGLDKLEDYSRIHKFIIEKINANRIHLIFYIQDTRSRNAFIPYEAELIKNLIEKNIDIYFIFTHAYNHSEEDKLPLKYSLKKTFLIKVIYQKIGKTIYSL